VELIVSMFLVIELCCFEQSQNKKNKKMMV